MEKKKPAQRRGKSPGPVERLAGGVAHDLNNILLVVRGYADLALAEKGTAPEVGDHLRELITGLRRASDLVGQLFAVARRSPASLVPLDLNEAVQHALGQGQQPLPARARVSFLPLAGLPLVRVSGDLIDRLVSSLLAYALETAPDGGSVEIRTNVEGADDSRGRWVILHVFRPGPVISEDERLHFFEPFHELPNGGRRKLGLGLAAARGITELLGGEIGLDSPPSGGAMFRVALPAAPGDSPSRPSAEGCTILIAEDDRSIRELARRVLSREGFSVLAATDGEEALRLFEENRDAIRIALLDDVMPKLGGRAVLQKIRERKPSLPVILCTGYSWSAEESPTGAGSEELLSKPYEPRELVRRVRRLLGRAGRVGAGMGTDTRILYIEDDPGLARLMQTKLAPEGYLRGQRAHRARGPPALRRGLPRPRHRRLPAARLQWAGRAARRSSRSSSGVPVIMATGAGNEEIAVSAMKLGAADYINKESYDKFFRLLPSVIEKALRQAEMARQKLRAEADLRESEERLRSILLSMDDAVLVADRNGLLVASRAPWNPARAATASPEWIGKAFSDVLPPAVAARFEAAFRAAQLSDRVEQFDYCLAADTTQAWYNAKVSPLKDNSGTFAGVTIVARDVTARKRAEDQLTFAIQAADAANRAKTDLLAGMSHELRTPLTAIIGYAEILLYEYFGTVNDKQKQQLDVILQCSHHLLDLINDILDISKIESGKTELEPSVVRIGALVSHTITLLTGDRGATSHHPGDPCAPRGWRAGASR